MPSSAKPRWPDFIGVGPPRTATTWLHQVLAGRVGLPHERKETEFFTRNYGHGIDWYLDYFRHCDPGLPMGEFSPMYFASDPARERIARHIPGCKIICSLRDPVERVWSQWRLMVRQVWTRAPFVDAIERHRELRESSRYGTHLQKWLETFGRERVLVLIYDDLERDPQAFVDQVTDFIGIARIDLAGSPVARTRVHVVPVAPKSPKLARNARNVIRWLNDRRYHRLAAVIRGSAVWRFCFERGEEFRPPSPEDDAAVRARFRPEVELVERLIGRDLTAWKEGRTAAKPPPSRAADGGRAA
jgi:LPS sulfotransferase NodH